MSKLTNEEWKALTKAGRLNAVLALLKTDPRMGYPTIAKRLGTTKSSIIGVMHRGGYSRPDPKRQKINPNCLPLVRALFIHAHAQGLYDADIARRSGYELRTITSMRHNHRNPSLRTFTEIAQAVGFALPTNPERTSND